MLVPALHLRCPEHRGWWPAPVQFWFAFKSFCGMIVAMEESFRTRPLFGRWIALDLRATRPLTLLGPAWAALCGAIASGGLLLKGQSILYLVLSLLLCDTLLTAWRVLWSEASWGKRSRNPHLWFDSYDVNPNPGFPRAFQSAGMRVAGLKDSVASALDSDIVGIVTAGALAASVAAVLGPIPLGLAVVAMVLSIAESRMSGSPGRGAWLKAITEIGLSWSVAELSLGSLSWLSLGYAISFTLIYRSLLGLATTRNSYWLALSNLAQVVVAGLLVVTNTPVGAGIVMLGLVAQILWQARYHEDRDGGAYARQVQSYVLVAMLICGFSLWF